MLNKARITNEHCPFNDLVLFLGSFEMPHASQRKQKKVSSGVA